MTRTSKAAVPACLTLSLIAAYLPVWLAGGPGSIPSLFLKFGLSRSGFFSGQWWQIGTHALLHANPVHLAANLACLLAFGIPCETELGRRRLLQIWAAGAVSGGLLHLALGGSGLLVGASGMASATILAHAAAFPYHHLPILRLRSKNLGLGILSASALLTLMSCLPSLPAWLAPATSIGHACHFGGALAGYWLGHTRPSRPA